MKRALIFGITGQDGSYLAELLLEKGYEVHGMIRRSSSFNTGRIDHIFDRLHLHYGEITDATRVMEITKLARPVEIYNLAAQSHVRVSFDMPRYTAETIAGGAANVLEAACCTSSLVYQASSSEMFGGTPSVAEPLNEQSPFNPKSPYAVAKVAAHQMMQYYRQHRDVYACGGILFNHESPRRGQTFVTRKITRGLAAIKCGLADKLELGNVNAIRDWGHARDYVRAMWLMLQQDEPKDYVIATGQAYSVWDFGEAAAKALDLDWATHVVPNVARYLRPSEVDVLIGDATLARKELGWQPDILFEELVREMAQEDYAEISKSLCRSVSSWAPVQ